MLSVLDAIAPSESSLTWWASFQDMDIWMQVFWGCAVVGSLIFIVQMVLTLVGMDSSDMDVDFDGGDTMDLGGGISLFSIKNFVNFLVGFGWGGVCFSEVIDNAALEEVRDQYIEDDFAAGRIDTAIRKAVTQLSILMLREMKQETAPAQRETRPPRRPPQPTQRTPGVTRRRRAHPLAASSSGFSRRSSSLPSSCSRCS